MMTRLEQAIFDIISNLPKSVATPEDVARQAGTSVKVTVNVIGDLSDKSLVTIRRHRGGKWEMRPVIWKRRAFGKRSNERNEPEGRA